jgi:hypothetical protein
MVPSGALWSADCSNTTVLLLKFLFWLTFAKYELCDYIDSKTAN